MILKEAFQPQCGSPLQDPTRANQSRESHVHACCSSSDWLLTYPSDNNPVSSYRNANMVTYCSSTKPCCHHCHPNTLMCHHTSCVLPHLCLPMLPAQLHRRRHANGLVHEHAHSAQQPTVRGAKERQLRAHCHRSWSNRCRQVTQTVVVAVVRARTMCCYKGQGPFRGMDRKPDLM